MGGFPTQSRPSANASPITQAGTQETLGAPDLLTSEQTPLLQALQGWSLSDQPLQLVAHSILFGPVWATTWSTERERRECAWEKSAAPGQCKACQSPEHPQVLYWRRSASRGSAAEIWTAAPALAPPLRPPQRSARPAPRALSPTVAAPGDSPDPGGGGGGKVGRAVSRLGEAGK